MSASRTVEVDLEERSYPIRIGAGTLAWLGEELRAAVGGRVFTVTDATVEALHGEALRAALEAGGFATPRMHVIPPGEASKSFGGLRECLDAMFAARLSRGDAVIAFGGGVVGDLAGFASAVFKRGCALVQVPTTLLAQVDSSVGGKTAINVAQGKNLVGAFHQPRLVLIDTDLLETLPEREMRAGYAEILKYGLIDDAGFFSWLEANGAGVLAREPDALAHAIAVSCAAKARVVAADEREGGARALLNLGHTFAHALEARAGYDGSLLHGEAVAAGMLMAFELSQRLELCPAGDVARLEAHLRARGLERPATLARYLNRPDTLLAAMDQDKKNAHGRLKLILARGIGESFILPDADRDAVRAYLEALHLRHSTEPPHAV